MTEELPEIRASDAERDDVAEVLREALAEGRLTVEEFQERLDAAYQARTDRQLAVLVRDLPHGQVAAAGGAAGGASTPAARDATASGDARRRWAQRIGATPGGRWGIGFFGGFVRRSTWTVPRRFTGVAVLGGGQLDLRDARFEAPEVEIRCFAFCGGVDIVVDPGVEVEVRGVGVMGGFDASATGAGEPGAPRVVVTGVATWGGVGVRRKPRHEEGAHAPLERGEPREELEERDARRTSLTKGSEQPSPQRGGEDDATGGRGEPA